MVCTYESHRGVKRKLERARLLFEPFGCTEPSLRNNPSVIGVEEQAIVQGAEQEGFCLKEARCS